MTHDTDAPVLKAILFADLAHYSRLAAVSEYIAVDLVTRCMAVFRHCCAEHRGEFVKSTGDGVLVIFDGITDALDYGLHVQARLAEMAATEPAAGNFRIGVHIGEVHRRSGDVFGHAVNLAARIQTVAAPGGLCATQEVYRATRGSPRFAFRFAGRQALKNMPEVVPLYHVDREDDANKASPAGRFSISVIDGLSVLDARDEPLTFRSQAVQALIGYLSLASGFRDFRDKIAALLWPDRPLSEANAALANCIRSVARSASGGLDGAVQKQSGFVCLDPARVNVDLRAILNDLKEGKIDDALMQRPDWPEAILYGFDSVSNLYRAWIRVTRHSFRDHAEEDLEHLIGRFDSSELIAKHAATALLVLEPSHEGAVRCLMRHHAANHNAAAAMRIFEALRRTLREQHGLEPSAETTALAAVLTEPLPPRGAKRPAESRKPVIAIGEFESEGESVAARTSGFRADLIINLSKFRELTIVDFHGQSGSSGMDYLLTAECWAAGGETRLAARLEAAGERRIVWSDSYELSLDNWLSAQRQLVGRIASLVDVYLSHDRLTRSLQRLPGDLSVYDLWLRGEHLLLRWSAPAEDEAEALFERAIAADPNFAPAYASLASVYSSRQFIKPGLPRRPDTERRAVELARRAVELDPLDARNLMAVAFSAAMTGQFEQSELHFELASELNANDPKIVVGASLGLVYMGRREAAQRLLDHASSLTALFPAYLWSHIAVIRFFLGDYEGAVTAADRSQNVIIDTPGWKAAALGRLGRFDERGAAIGRLVQAVDAAWVGPPRPSPAGTIDWFVNAFPIRHDSDRKMLASALLDG